MIHNKLHGEYRIEIRRNNEVIQELDWFDNLILDTGLERIGLQVTANATSNPLATHCRVGTGSSTPNVTQSNLDSQIAWTSTTSPSATNSGGPNYISQQIITYTFTQGAIVGNITEVGVGWNSSGSTLFSRALITDINGNPTAITLTSIDQMTIYYRLNIYPTLTDSTGTLTINGVQHAWTARIASASSWGQDTSLLISNRLANPYGCGVFGSNAALGPITGSPSGSNLGYYNWTSTGFSIGVVPYISGSYYSDSAFSFNINTGNASGGIGGLVFQFGGSATVNYQIVFSPAIPKDNTKSFTIYTRISWSRI